MFNSAISLNYNSKYDENLYFLQQIEQRKMKAVLPTKKDLEAPNNQEIVKKQSGFININEKRAQLDVRLTNILNIQLCLFHYYEIPLFGHRKPLIINFTFTDQAKMKFYISRNTLTPNRFNFEEAFQRKQVLRYTEPGEDLLFSSQFLYMAVFSQQQTSLHAKLQYGVKVIQQIKKTEVEIQERPQTASYFRSSYFTKVPQRQTKDLIMINMNLKRFEPEIQKKQLQVRRVQSAKRFQETIQKKQFIDAEKIEIVRSKYDYQLKKKLISEILQVRSQIDNQITDQQQQWIQIIFMVKLCKQIRTKYCQQANFLMEQATITRRKNRTRQNLRKYLQISGDTIQKRCVVYSFMSIDVFIGLTNITSKAEVVLCSFMKSYGQIGDIIQKGYKFRRLIRLVLDSYRNYKKKVNAYVQRIVMLWNRQWGVLYQQIQKEDLEKVREIRKQLSKTIVNLVVDDEIKKSPYLDSKLQWVIAQNYYKQLRQQFLDRLAELRSQYQGSSLRAYSMMVATQGFDKNQANLFAVVNQQVIKQLVYKYMLEKKMIQSVLMKKT